MKIQIDWRNGCPEFIDPDPGGFLGPAVLMWPWELSDVEPDFWEDDDGAQSADDAVDQLVLAADVSAVKPDWVDLEVSGSLTRAWLGSTGAVYVAAMRSTSASANADAGAIVASLVARGEGSDLGSEAAHEAVVGQGEVVQATVEAHKDEHLGYIVRVLPEGAHPVDADGATREESWAECEVPGGIAATSVRLDDGADNGLQLLMRTDDYCPGFVDWLMGGEAEAAVLASLTEAIMAEATEDSRWLRPRVVAVAEGGLVDQLRRLCLMEWLCWRTPYQLQEGDDLVGVTQHTWQAQIEVWRAEALGALRDWLPGAASTVDLVTKLGLQAEVKAFEAATDSAEVARGIDALERVNIEQEEELGAFRSGSSATSVDSRLKVMALPSTLPAQLGDTRSWANVVLEADAESRTATMLLRVPTGTTSDEGVELPEIGVEFVDVGEGSSRWIPAHVTLENAGQIRRVRCEVEVPSGPGEWGHQILIWRDAAYPVYSPRWRQPRDNEATDDQWWAHEDLVDEAAIACRAIWGDK